MSAAFHGDVDAVLWARDNGCTTPDESITAAAARGGDLAALEQLRQLGLAWDVQTCSAAAAGGHLEVLQWARQAGCAWDTTTCHFAAAAEYMEVLQSASRQEVGSAVHQAVWDERDALLNSIGWLSHFSCYNTWLTKAAVSCGPLVVLQGMRRCCATCWACNVNAAARQRFMQRWARQAEWWPRNGRREGDAVARRHLALLQWAFDNGCPWDKTVCSLAAAAGHLSILSWARAAGCPWDELVCSLAAEGGHLELLQWAWREGCPWDVRTCSAAALGGHLDVLRWAREAGCPWDSWTCSMAAAGGHLGVLQWARQAGCPWDVQTCRLAAAGGHLEVLQWARQAGCPWSSRTCSSAAEFGHLDLLQWARQQGCNWDSNTCFAAAWGGHLHVLRWARQAGCHWDIWACCAAAYCGHLGVLRWLRDQSPPCAWTPYLVVRAAVMGGHTSLIDGFQDLRAAALNRCRAGGIDDEHPGQGAAAGANGQRLDRRRCLIKGVSLFMVASLLLFCAWFLVNTFR